MEQMIDQLPIILGVLLGISESLALIPACKSNGILDAIIKVLKVLSKKE
jgi:hypothetical protein